MRVTLQQFKERVGHVDRQQHFYILESTQARADDLADLFSVKGDGYMFHQDYATFGVDDARRLVSLVSEKNTSESYYIMRCGKVTVEAQNTLLKSFEEPRGHKLFILIVPDKERLVAPLRSRAESYVLDAVGEMATTQEVEGFVGMTLAERFDFNKKQTDKKNADRLTIDTAHTFLSQLERLLHQQGKTDCLKTIMKAKRYLSANGASIKMILDMVAISIV